MINKAKSIAVFIGCYLFVSALAFAQQGVISGNVIDKETGEELIGVTVQIEGTTKGAATDISGSYQITVAPGTYTLVASYVSYATQKVTDVEVKANETTRIDIGLVSDDIQLGEVVVTASQINNNEVALLKLQQKSYAVQDGISAGEMQRLGIGNSAESMKMVTGATIESGKYVVVRGLGDRYSLTQMNGVTLPSSDPYRNSSSMDLIPSSMIENIVTTKTFTPDQPGNFTGGNVNVTTKSLPDKFYISVGAAVGYNTQSSFVDNFRTDPVSGSKDWLGYDDGSREMPGIFQNEANRNDLTSNIYLLARNPSEHNQGARDLLDNTSKALAGRGFTPVNKSVLLNHSYSLALGNRKTFLGKEFGYNLGLNYSKDYKNFNDKQINIYRASASAETENLPTDFAIAGNEGVESTSLGGIFSLAAKLNTFNTLSFDYTYSNDASINALDMEGIWPAAVSGAHLFQSRSVGMVQRTLSNYQLKGTHVLPGLNKAEIHWLGGYVSSRQYEPDTRVFANMVREPNIYSMNDSEGQLPFHFFRDLDDVQYSGKIDFELPVGTKGQHKIKAGVFGSKKEREFDEYRFQLSLTGVSNTDLYTSFREADGDFEQFFRPENAGILGVANNGNYLIGNWYENKSRPTNFYSGHEQVLAAYGMGVFQLADKLKFIGGVRVEKTDFEVESEDPRREAGVIDELDFLPSVNLIYALNDNSNLRLSGSQTLARPNMRELAPFESFDLVGGFLILGNPELERTTIRNFDVRYEFFPKGGEIFAVSAFYKDFTNPIQKQLIPVASGGQYQYVNVDKGELAGVELEFRKELGFISPLFENFKFSTNFTYTYSKVDLTDEEYETFSKINPDLKTWRPFQAQSPYIVNVNLSYVNDEKQFEVAAYANAFGRRLFANGFGGAPDVYEVYGREDTDVPTPDLNLMISKTIFKNLNVSLKGENLLDYKVIRNQEFKGNYFTTEAYSIGSNYTLSLKYSL